MFELSSPQIRNMANDTMAARFFRDIDAMADKTSCQRASRTFTSDYDFECGGDVPAINVVTAMENMHDVYTSALAQTPWAVGPNGTLIPTVIR
jgi:hypothetical protein